jgi:cytidylate kinase
MHSIEAIIDRQLRRWELERTIHSAEPSEVSTQHPLKPVITISRQRGSGGALIAGKLAAKFSYTLLHRDTIERICESTGYKRRIIESLDEHGKSQVAIWFDSMVVGKYVDTSDYIKCLLETIYSISRLGGVVVVGRGANFIVGREQGFHIRIIAPRSTRIRNMMQHENLSEKDATREVDSSDHDRAEFIRKTFGKAIDDPLYYDLVVNHLTISIDSAANLIALATMEKFEGMRSATSKTSLSFRSPAMR